MATKPIMIRVGATDETRGAFRSVSEGLNDLKRVAGARGSLKDTFELLRGGGAVAGLTFGGRLLKDAATSMREYTDAARDGTIQTGELVEKLASAVPIYGEIWQAGRQIREMMTGHERSNRIALASAASLNSLADIRLDIQKRTNKATEDHLQAMRDMNREMVRINLSGNERDVFDIRGQGEQERQTIKLKVEADIQGIENAKKAAEAVRAQIAVLQTEIDKVTQVMAGSEAEKQYKERKAEIEVLTNQFEALNEAAKGSPDQIRAQGLERTGQSERLEASRLAELRKRQFDKLEEDAGSHAQRLQQIQDESELAQFNSERKFGEDYIREKHRQRDEIQAVQDRLKEQVKPLSSNMFDITGAISRGTYMSRAHEEIEALKRAATDAARQAMSEEQRKTADFEFTPEKKKFEKPGDLRAALDTSRFLTGVQAPRDDALIQEQKLIRRQNEQMAQTAKDSLTALNEILRFFRTNTTTGLPIF